MSARRTISAAAIAAATAWLTVAGCQSTSPPPAAPTGLTADQVTAEMVDGGCLAPGTSAAVVQEMQTGKDEALKAALACLFDGGTIVGCNVPCERAGLVRRPVDP